jgi:preprotein translocase subunit SecY
VANPLQNIFKIPELKNRILFTLAMLAVYRIGVFVTVPGVDRQVVLDYMNSSGGSLLGLVNLFSGGALENISIFALGIMPYISASIILQLLTVIVPAVERLNKEGDAGRRKINQWTRYGSVILSIVQGMALAIWLESLNSQSGTGAAIGMGGWGFRFLVVLALTTGTTFIMWLGEQISERGIGNGISMVIYAGIVAGLPEALQQTWSLFSNGQISMLAVIFVGLLVFVVIGCIVYFETAQRRIPVQYAKRVVGRTMVQGASSYLPLKVNSSGVIPPIFASSILMFPATVANFAPESQAISSVVNSLNPGRLVYNVVYVALIVFFCYFYTAVTFNPVDVADNLKKSGGFVPGVRAGKNTAEYIDRVLSRITFGGALYISAVCVLPTALQSSFNVPFLFGGTALLIVVGVAIDTAQQIQSHLITHNYEGFGGGKGARVRGRRAVVE